MAYISFKKWLLREFRDVFGFDKDIVPKYDKSKKSEKPVNRFDIESVINYLEMHKLGYKEPNIKYVNEIHWGEGPGAIRLWIGTGLNVMLEKQAVDLTGTPRWITKKVYQIDQAGYGGYEDAVANELIEKLEKIDESPPDSPKHDYNELESLVSNIAGSLRRCSRPIFIFEGVRKLDDNSYIVRLGVRGQGNDAQDQQRVEENQTFITYDSETGLIRMTNYNIESPKKSHSWGIMPVDTDWYFCPTQSREEITETIANTMHWY